MNVLSGKKVLITRAEHQSESFVKELEVLGAKTVVVPAIKVISRMDQPAARTVMDKIDSYDWVIFTSANGVRFFAEALEAQGKLEQLKQCRIAAIGPKTEAVLEKKVRKADAMPARYISDDIAETLGDIKGTRILLARASRTRDVLQKDLLAKGAVIEDLPVYDIEENLDEIMIEGLRKTERPDYLSFTSSSTVRGMKTILEKAGKDWFSSVPSVCIGPVTAQTLTELGVQPFAVAEVFTIEGMIEAIERR